MDRVTSAWRGSNPGAAVGFLALRGVANPPSHPGLEEAKARLAAALGDRFSSREEIKSLSHVAAYTDFYKRFKSTYHVLLQVDSVALKGKPLPKVAALVEAMFMAELKNQVLTSGHDLAAVSPPVVMDLARGGERFVSLSGKEKEVKAGDTVLWDRDGCLGSIVYGPDQRSRIRPETEEALFVAWGVPGVEAGLVDRHLADLESYARLISPDLKVETREVLISA